ncbi:MAG: DUF2807 domain-containing protein [Candidatus Mcinerneyibacterium aminivorans]|uniref:DUF2807 domain-containing protein n=1 Tax=Candidatus Mcinerneyibacterium aminivorans TaxID=2703815 RepID=A0A5D0MDD2_9BACT|nr:MAG: DUF2807 domain-containing protein [Candidatus Mcinerneyibacterium aminivorans]
MKNNFKIFTIIIFLIFTGCISFLSGGIKNSGQIISRNYNKKNFKKINVSNTIKINLQQKDYFDIKVKIDRAYIDYFNIDIKGDTLYLYLDRNINYNNPDIVADITMPEIEKITASGVSKITMKKIMQRRIDIKLSGASELEAEVETDVLTIEESGASKSQITGKTEELYVDLSGVSKSYLNRLNSKRVYIQISGVSELKVFVKEAIEGKVSGASEVNIAGNPQKQILEKSGVSDITVK